MTELRVLGAIDVCSGHPGHQGVLTQPKRLALLVYLALAEPAGLHARDRLLALLWPEADDRSSRHSLRNALHALRRALGEGAILTRGEDWVGLDFRALRCDALNLRAHLAAGRPEDALALWTGELAPGFHLSGAPGFERWLEEQRADLRRAVREAAWARVRELRGAGEAEAESVRRALRLDPGNEPGTRQLMRLLAAAGDRSGAIRAYEDLAGFLERELETEPSTGTRALAAGLRSISAPESATADALQVVPTPGAVLAPAAVPPEGPKRRNALRAIGTGALLVLALGSASYFVRHPVSSSQVEAERAVLRLPARYRADTSAYGSYLRGLALRFQFRFTASRDTFAALVDRKPLYVPGLYGLAHAWIFTALNDLTNPDEAWPKIDELAGQALALDSSAASAWLALASEDMFARLDLPAAAGELARARLLDPLDPDVAGMQSVWFRFYGRMDSAVAEARLAHRLDPLSQLFARLVGKQLYFARRYEESRLAFATLLQDDPRWTRGWVDLVDLYRAMGRPRDAVASLRRVRAAEGDDAGAAALLPASTDSAAWRLLAADARRSVARLDRSARSGERVPASYFASAYAALGDTAATLRWLDSMISRNDSYLHQIRMDPLFDFLRRDPRYRAWESRSGLPPLSSGTAPGSAGAAPPPSARR